MDADLVQRLEQLAESQKHMEGRLTVLEDRMQATETLASRIPGVEARIGRIERLVMETQGEMRRLSRALDEHIADEMESFRRFESKLDRMLSKFDHIDRAMNDGRD